MTTGSTEGLVVGFAVGLVVGWAVGLVVGLDVGVGEEGVVGVEVDGVGWLGVGEAAVLEGLAVLMALSPDVGPAGVTGPQALAVRVSAASAMSVRVWRADPLVGA